MLFRSVSSANSTYSNFLNAATRSLYTNRIDCSKVTGTKYIALQATYAATTASTSNRLGLFVGYSIEGNNATTTAGTTITFPAANGTTATTYVTNIAISGYPWFHVTGITNDNGIGGAGAITNITVKATVQ